MLEKGSGMFSIQETSTTPTADFKAANKAAGVDKNSRIRTERISSPILLKK